MPVFVGNDADHALFVAIVKRYRHTSRTRFRMPPAWHSDGADRSCCHCCCNICEMSCIHYTCHTSATSAALTTPPLLTVLSCILLSSSLNSTELHLRGIAENTDPLQPIEWEAGRWERVEVLRSVSHHDMLMSWYVYINVVIIIWHRSEVRLGLGGLCGPVAAAHWCLDVWRLPVSCGTCERCNEINEIKDSTFKKLRPHLDWFIPHPDQIMKHEATCILIRVCLCSFSSFCLCFFCASFFSYHHI